MICIKATRLESAAPAPILADMIELTLPTMTCGHCVRTVTRTVQSVDAAARLEVDLPQQRVRIESAQPKEAFERALAEEGYAAVA
jgi:copper chaperone